jgi:hypothetical protein
MFRQKSLFIGEYTQPILAGICAIFLIALTVKGHDTLELFSLTLVGLLVALVTYRSTLAGILIGMTEIFVGGHGHLIAAPLFGFPLSLRIVIFVAIMGTTLLLLVKKKIHLTFNKKRDYPWIILLLALTLGVIVGIIQKNGWGNVFDDVNGYMTLAYLLPLAAIQWDERAKNLLLQTLTASAIFVSIFTLTLSYLFTHVETEVARTLYVFIRDTRLTEVTLQSMSNGAGVVTQPLLAPFFGTNGYWYRIFMQSQFFVAALWLVLIAYIYSGKKPAIETIQVLTLLLLFSSTLALSLSRSFFVGMTVALLVIMASIGIVYRPRLREWITRTLSLLSIGITSLILVWLMVMIPLPSRPAITEALFYATSVDETRASAVTSRWTLLDAMHEKIGDSPIIGTGFGESLTYITDDPRTRDEHPDGVLTTYRFEWGYHDIWIKMGILGLLAFGYYFWSLFRAGLHTLKIEEKKWLTVGLMSSMVMLAIAHIFSPYLNHPIGLIWMLALLPFVYKEK